MRQQMFRIQARIFDTAFLEIRGRRLQDFENGHLSGHPERSRGIPLRSL
jgi:hypothetical protein